VIRAIIQKLSNGGNELRWRERLVQQHALGHTLHGPFIGMATGDVYYRQCRVDRSGAPGNIPSARSEPCERSDDDPARFVPVDPTDASAPLSPSAYARLGAKTRLVFPADWNNVTADYAGTVFSIVGVKPRS
jgi:hypothetical protein